MSAQIENSGSENIQAALLDVLKKLSPEHQRQALDFAEFLVAREEKTINGQPVPQTEANPAPHDKVRRRQPGEGWPDTERLQEQQWLKQHRHEYGGQWVALEGSRLISHGADVKQVFAEVKLDGAGSPFITYVESADDLPFGGW